MTPTMQNTMQAGVAEAHRALDTHFLGKLALRPR